MPSAFYVFRDCVPEGNIDVVNIRPGEILSRAWSFRVNQPPDFGPLDAPRLLQNSPNGVFDSRSIARGYDGRLFDESGRLLATVNQWQVQINVRTVDHQPAGYKMVWAIPISHTVTLTFTEVLVNDALILGKILDTFREVNPEQGGYVPDAVLNFQGKIQGRAPADR